MPFVTGRSRGLHTHGNRWICCAACPSPGMSLRAYIHRRDKNRARRMNVPVFFQRGLDKTHATTGLNSMPGASSQHRGGADGDQFRSLGSLPSAAGFRTFTTPRNNKVATAGKAPCTRGRLSQAAAAKKQGDKQTKRIRRLLLFCLRLFSLGGKYRPGLVEVHVLHHLLHALPDLFAFLCRGVVGCVEGKQGEEDHVNRSTPT